MKKNNRIVTPKVVVNFPYLNEMDTAFKQNVYKVTEAWIKKDEAKNFIEELDNFIDIEYKKARKAGKDCVKQIPYEDKGDYIVFKNKFKSQYKPKQYSLKGKEVDEQISGGSVVKLSLSYNSYVMMGKCGISFYIDALQIVELNDKFNIIAKTEDKKASDFGFDISDEDLENDDLSSELEELGFDISDEELDEIDVSDSVLDF